MNELDYGELKIKYDTVCMNVQELLDLTVNFLHAHFAWMKEQSDDVNITGLLSFGTEQRKLIAHIEKNYHPEVNDGELVE